MSSISFENYGKSARELSSHTEIAGRYATQAIAERAILPDVFKKLQIAPNNSILDVGSGAGTLAIPLSFICKKVIVVDHPDVLGRLKKRCEIDNLKFLPGNFLEIDFQEKVDKILVYSVLHYLEDEQEVVKFIEKALGMLNPGGRVLFGDIPNSSAKKRFSDSAYGRRFIQNWDQKMSGHSPESKIINLPNDHKMAVFDDDTILRLIKLIRLRGLHAYVLAQPPGLPFGHTREDILVVHPEKEIIDDTTLEK